MPDTSDFLKADEVDWRGTYAGRCISGFILVPARQGAAGSDWKGGGAPRGCRPCGLFRRVDGTARSGTGAEPVPAAAQLRRGGVAGQLRMSVS